jgi:hypothetical protein
MIQVAEKRRRHWKLHIAVCCFFFFLRYSRLSQLGSCYRATERIRSTEQFSDLRE